VTLVGQEELRGKNCHKLVRRIEDPKRGRHTRTYWLLADGSYRMVRLEIESMSAHPRPPRIGARIIVTAEEVAEYGDGIVLPKVTKVERYALSKDMKPWWIDTVVFSMDQVRVNAELGDELFVLDFPIGSFVSDDTRTAAYVGGRLDEAETRVSRPPPRELEPSGPPWR